MNKPKYRYNHKTREWEDVFKVNSEVIEMPGFVNPETGLILSYKRPLYIFGKGSIELY